MFNKKELAPGIMVYSDVMENYTQFVPAIEHFMNLNIPEIEWSNSYVYKDGKEMIDENRSSKTYFVEYNKTNSDILSQKYLLDLYARETITKFSNPIELDYQKYYNVVVPDHKGYSILKYSEGSQFLDHIDHNVFEPRTISTVWYINDNYEGGEICFSRFNINYKPKANEMILFPSTYTYNHSVLPIKNGIRYSVVSWLN
jgi:predicted 2-oxoglutarate/Fe(II)-dependent dioxygenase YbiX